MDSGHCRHRTGKKLNRCRSYDVSSISDCRAACTSYDLCLGYIYETSDSPICRLIPSSNACPSGYDLRRTINTQLATTANDIVQNDAENLDVQCYVKM